MITIAVSTGNLLPGALAVLRAARLTDLAPEDVGRRLVLELDGGLRLVTVRPMDVAAYVDHGSADLGVVGKDALWETERVHYELLDLHFGACRLVMAVPEDSPIVPGAPWPPILRVATKYLRRAAGFFAERGQEVELIRLHGSVELAPLVDLADAVVDLTATGTTLRENRLRIVEEVAPSTARLIANQVSLRTRGGEVQEVVARIRAAAGSPAAGAA